MSTANQLQLDAANKAIRAVFDNEFQETGEGPLIQAVAMQTRSKAKTVEYNFLHSFDEMREWVGPRHIANLAAESFSIPNVKYESSLHVDRVDVESDSLGVYTPVVRNMPRAYFRKRREKIASLLLNGNVAGNTSYDGVTFFNTAHPNDDGSTQSNFSATTSLTGPNTDTIFQTMEELVDHRGNPLDVTPDTLIVGPKLRATARDLFGIATDFGNNNAGNNPYFQMVNVIVESRITDDSYYFVDTSKVLKPFIVQDADDLELQTLASSDDQYVIENDGFFYGTRARMGFGYGFWQLAHKGKES